MNRIENNFDKYKAKSNKHGWINSDDDLMDLEMSITMTGQYEDSTDEIKIYQYDFSKPFYDRYKLIEIYRYDKDQKRWMCEMIYD